MARLKSAPVKRQKKCPRCQGTGLVPFVVSNRTNVEPVYIVCIACKGEGTEN